MHDTASLTAGSSLLLWLLATTVAVLASHVGMGWARLARRRPALRESWRALLVAAVTLGTGLCAVFVLGQAAEVQAFALGYSALWAGLLWLGASAGGFVVAWTLARSPRWWALLGSGALLAALSTGIQAGWVGAAGFRPGPSWNTELFAAGALLLVIGLCVALWLGFSATVNESGRRQLWRVVASVVAGFTLAGAHQVLLQASGLAAQVGSVYAKEIPGTVLILLGGALLPMVLAMMGLDVHFRQQRSRHSSRGPGAAFAGQRQRKRRYGSYR
jgi:NO-binding membrane sensor protein with MHYT domain